MDPNQEVSVSQIDTDSDPSNGDTPFKTFDIDDGHSVGVTPF